MSRRFFWLAIAIVVTIGLYTAGWFYAANLLVSDVRTALVELSRGRENRAVCEELAARGYPFRIGLFCDATYFERAAIGASASTGAFRSAAQVYAPVHVVAEADGPARITLPGLVPLDVTWEALRASARLARPLPQRISIEGKKLAAIADMPGTSGPLAFRTESVELHMRPAGPDIDVALRVNAFETGRLLLSKGALPLLTGIADLSLKDGIEMLRHTHGDLRGISVDVRQVEISGPDGARFTASGTAGIGEDGLVEAQLMLSTNDPAALSRIIAAAFPEAGSGPASAIAALSALGSNPSLPLVITRGEARLGFISLGSIPAL